MAILRHVPTNTDHSLAARHVVGRSRTCQLHIDANNVSGHHAEITWDGRAWHLRDLGSRNGTFVVGQAIGAGHQVSLEPGMTIGFGAPANDYCFVDNQPPRLIAFGPNGAVVADDDVLCLPSGEECEFLIFREDNDQWVVENTEGTRPIQDEERIVVRDMSFDVFLPGSIAVTREATQEEVLEFTVSHDGDHIDLHILDGAIARQIETRAHTDVLLELARTRIADMARDGLPETEHGWMHRDDLMRALGIDDPQLLNLWVHRARQQLALKKLRGVAKIIERRESAGQLRLGLRRLRIRVS
jgi:hypothetical protein